MCALSDTSYIQEFIQGDSNPLATRYNFISESKRLGTSVTIVTNDDYGASQLNLLFIDYGNITPS
jgi:hypothetical protein